MKTSRKTVMMGILFAVSAFVLAGKLLMPTPIQIVIQGEEEPIVVGQLFRYTQFDVAVISISAIILAASSFYLWSINSVEAPQVLPAAEKRDTELEVAFAIRLLDGDRRKLFSEIVEAGGEILQSDLHAHTGFSKAKITRVLDYLELKGLIVRKSYGMTNKIIIKNSLMEHKK
jgi:uncharacterized membrane protein